MRLSKPETRGLVLYVHWLLCAGVFIFALIPSFAFAGAYSTSISPSGAQITNPITATFNIQDFAQRDFGTQCTTGFVPAEMRFNYWFGQGLDYNEISPAVVPTSAMISSGIYTATFNLSVGQAVDSIGVEFFQYAGGGGIRCVFYGRQPNSVSEEPWTVPLFTVIEAAPEKVYVGVARQIQNQSPFVSFVNFPKEKTLSGTKKISYSAIDYDNAPYGLKDFPIHVYLSNDGGVIWKELAKNEPNNGVYSFDTNTVPDGQNYTLKITALDNGNQAGEVISNAFVIDNTKPTFKISLGSASDAIKEKDKINLTITSSENITETPRVQITQSGADSQPLVVNGFGRDFSAPYTILKGHVGSAVISISGKDVAGNIGKEITSGETFVVSRLGPPPPTIKNIANNESFSDPTIDIFGSAPLSREIIFMLNEGDRITVKPQENGDFSLKGILLSPSHFGRNTLKFLSIGKDGLESDEKILTIKLNSPPKLSWVTPPVGTLSGTVQLEWQTVDVNNDTIVYAIAYSANGGKSWDYFSKGILEHAYTLNTGEFFDGDNYLIKIEANDGSITSEIISEKLVFRNNIRFSFTDAPANYLFSTTRPGLKGEARIAEHNIVLVRYSLEKEEWVSAEAVDGKFDSPFEKFLIKFSKPFVDGRHVLFIEVEDDAGNRVRTFQSFIVDTLPPVSPSITFPSSDQVISRGMDGDPLLGGIQIDMAGDIEAGADLELVVNNRTYSTVAGSQGKFIFKGVTFLDRGVNRYFLSSTDAAGNISKKDGFIISNNPPVLFLLEPKSGAFLSGTKQIQWRASDADDDSLVFQVLYRPKNKNWTSVAQNLTASEFSIDISKFSEGEYELQVLANDGLTEVSATLEKIFIDNVAPEIRFDIAGPIYASKVSLLFSGNATDNLSGIQFIEYSLDGATWFKALLADGYLEKKAVFVIRHPFELKDGEYNFGVRAIDAAGNISKPTSEKIVIDSTPPRIGSFILSYGGISIVPDSDVFTVPESVALRFVISLERDTKRASVFFGGRAADLLKNGSTGLWEADVVADHRGTSTIAVSAEDAFGNITKNKTIGHIIIVPQGKTIANAKISIFSRDEESQSLSVWPASAYGAKNPIYADEKGAYALFLPVGTYQLLVEKTGYQRLRISDFKIINPRFIGFDLSLQPRSGFRGRVEDLLEKLTLFD